MFVYFDSALTDFLRLLRFLFFFWPALGCPWIFWGILSELLLFWPLFWLLWFVIGFGAFLSLLLIPKFNEDLFGLPFSPWVIPLVLLMLEMFFCAFLSSRSVVDSVFLLFSLWMNVSTFFSPFSCSLSFLLCTRFGGFSFIWMIDPKLTEFVGFYAFEAFLFLALLFFLLRSVFHCL